MNNIDTLFIACLIAVSVALAFWVIRMGLESFKARRKSKALKATSKKQTSNRK